MASRPDTKHAVTVFPVQGAVSVLIVVSNQGAAAALANMINDNTDAKAQVEGPVYELPMVVTASAESDPVVVTGMFWRDFGRVFQPARRLLELRDMNPTKESNGPDYWTATALWTFPEVPPVMAADASQAPNSARAAVVGESV